MKKYDFDELIPRRGTNSVKWDVPQQEGVLPMWVADMDFKTAPAVIEALRRRVEHGIFGYTKVPEAYYKAIVDWFGRRHNWKIDPASIIYTTGVVPALSAIIKAMTVPGDKVLLQTPVYNCFFSCIRNNGCEMVSAPLIYRPDGYVMDFEAFERQAADPKVKLFILCNPHNPAGRVWTRDELMRVGDICQRNGVFVIADEIHCELAFNNHHYTPFASLGRSYEQNSVTCVSPSKAFNLAGLQIANIVASDADVRKRIDRAINDNEVCDVNPFGVVGLMAAYNESEEWLDALREYLWQNYLYVCDFFAQKLPDYRIVPLEGTYLVWIDCSASGMKSEELSRRLLDEERLFINAGGIYGSEGDNFIRLNIACPRERLNDGLQRLWNLLSHTTR